MKSPCYTTFIVEENIAAFIHALFERFGLLQKEGFKAMGRE
jgi:hypothetical protein